MESNSTETDTFQRNLSDEELAELVHLGDRMTASMREMLAGFDDGAGEFGSVSDRLYAGSAGLSAERRLTILGSLSLIKGSLTTLQASLKVVGGSVGPTVTFLRNSK